MRKGSKMRILLLKLECFNLKYTSPKQPIPRPQLL